MEKALGHPAPPATAVDDGGQSDPASRPDVCLTCRDLSFGYQRGHEIIRNVSADLKPGQLTAMIGPNAAGKSTLLRLLLGQLKPWEGSVRINGQELWAMAPRRRARWVSYVPQKVSTSFAFTVRQVVAMGRYAVVADPHATQAAIEECDLNQIADTVFAELSVGQQQRVLLARAVAQAAGTGRVMLLDEPGSAMDLAHLQQMMRTLQRLAGHGLAVLVVVQDLNLAARYADQVWLLHQGRLGAYGPWDEVLKPHLLETAFRVTLRETGCTTEGRPVFVADG